MPANRFQLLTIDLDDTVWPCWPVINAAEQALEDWLTATAPRLTEVHSVVTMRDHRRQVMRDHPDIAHDLSRVRQHSLTRLLDEFGYPLELVDQAMALFFDHRNRIEPFDDALPALRALHETHCLVSVTNGNSDPERTPLRGLFHHSLTPIDAGAAKPDPAMFEMAMALADANPEQTLHIGDEPYLDVEAARQAGLSAVWVNRGQRDWPADLAPPEAEFSDLGELYEWLFDDQAP